MRFTYINRLARYTCLSQSSFIRPAGVLVVPGPGLIHALPGIANAAVNCWYAFCDISYISYLRLVVQESHLLMQ